MTKEAAWKWYWQGIKDASHVDERVARIYFEKEWTRQHPPSEHNPWIDK